METEIEELRKENKFLQDYNDQLITTLGTYSLKEYLNKDGILISKLEKENEELKDEVESLNEDLNEAHEKYSNAYDIYEMINNKATQRIIKLEEYNLKLINAINNINIMVLKQPPIEQETTI